MRRSNEANLPMILGQIAYLIHGELCDIYLQMGLVLTRAPTVDLPSVLLGRSNSRMVAAIARSGKLTLDASG